MKKFLIKISIISVIIFTAGCTKLDNQLNGSLPDIGGGSSAGGPAVVAPLLKATYVAFRNPYQDQARLWCLQEHTSDEAVGPTRGGDWDDNGIWRVLHSHQWDADHGFIQDTYSDLGRIIFNGTDILRLSPSPQQEAEARFLRAFATLSMLDGWDQCPYREPGGDPAANPKVRKGVEALDWIIAEVNAAMPNLPSGAANVANKNAAKVLLMKCYLNKAVYANRTAPAFAAADMNQVISLADQIISSGTYSLSSNIFDNFAPNNDGISTENIFTFQNIGGSESGNIRSRWFCTLHYNQNPSGWNGFTTLSDFYSKFEAVDKRRGGNPYPGMTNGISPGFLVGQQFTGAGVPLKDRKGNNLVFTPAVALKEAGNNLEVTGIRVVKYPIDYVSGDNSNNDYVLYRYSDVLLMKAEAILRGGTATAVAPTTPLAAVNMVRARVTATALASVSLDQLSDERGREFYWEGMRRTDMVRFGKFLAPRVLKSGTSDSKYLLFPIPNQQLAINPNLVQNAGY